jgi:hypothetical protein
MKFLKALFSWFFKPKSEDLPMADAPVETPDVPVNTDTLKALLKTLGHDLDAVWEEAIALAKKADQVRTLINSIAAL